MRAKPFTQDHPDGGSIDSGAWQDVDDSELVAPEARFSGLIRACLITGAHYEAITECDLILPVLQFWTRSPSLPQQTTCRRRSRAMPPHLFVGDQEFNRAARGELLRWKRFHHGTVIIEPLRCGPVCRSTRSRTSPAMVRPNLGPHRGR